MGPWGVRAAGLRGRRRPHRLGRLYLEDVEAGGLAIDQAVRHMAEGAPPAWELRWSLEA